MGLGATAAGLKDLKVWYNEGMTYAVVYFILLLLGALCFLRSALGHQVVQRNGVTARDLSLVPLGLLFWILVPLIQFGRVVFN